MTLSNPTPIGEGRRSGLKNWSVIVATLVPARKNFINGIPPPPRSLTMETRPPSPFPMDRLNVYSFFFFKNCNYPQ